jgi:hypothetical protein
MNRNGYSNPTKEAVQQGIRDWGSQATGGVPGGTQDAMSRARAETGSISPDKFQGRDLGPSDLARGIQNDLTGREAEINHNADERKTSHHQGVEDGASAQEKFKKGKGIHETGQGKLIDDAMNHTGFGKVDDPT